jgi:hypothetical protein
MSENHPICVVLKFKKVDGNGMDSNKIRLITLTSMLIPIIQNQYIQGFIIFDDGGPED